MGRDSVGCEGVEGSTVVTPGARPIARKGELEAHCELNNYKKWWKRRESRMRKKRERERSFSSQLNFTHEGMSR